MVVYKYKSDDMKQYRLLAEKKISRPGQSPVLSFPWDYDENPWTLTNNGPHDWKTGSNSQSGLDFDKDNTPRRVLSMFDGEIYFADLDKPFKCNVKGGQITRNPTVKIRATDGSGWELWYLHLSKIYVNGTQEHPVPVQAGDLLGLSGNEGCSDGVHLHVELLIDGQHASWHIVTHNFIHELARRDGADVE
jgi:murein DD-endopeptidase MepM/ murein hydrolase activator NlpD